MSYGNQPYGMTPFGGGAALFQLVDATAISPCTLALTFSEAPNLESSSTTDPANFFIERILGNYEVLPVRKIIAGSELNELRLITDTQKYTLYHVRVNEVLESVFGSSLDPSVNSADFTGFPSVGRLRARAIRADRVLVLFNQEMRLDSALLASGSYRVFDSDGVLVSVAGVTPNLLVNPTRVTLQLGADLTSGRFYSIEISSTISTTLGLKVVPSTTKIDPCSEKKTLRIPISRFSGELRSPGPESNQGVSEVLRLEETLAVELVPYRVEPSSEILKEILSLSENLTISGSRFPECYHLITLSVPGSIQEVSNTARRPDTRSTVELSLTDRVCLRESLQVLPAVEKTVDPGLANLFGNPQGLVFFSPSLTPGGAANSILQVDQVRTCTEAQDIYKFPQAIDPKPLYTHGAGVTPTPIVTFLNQASLFVEFYRLGEAKLNLRDCPEDVLLSPEDSSSEVDLREDATPVRISKLNGPGWVTFKNPMPPVTDFVPAYTPGDPIWDDYLASVHLAYPFITVDNLSPLVPSSQPTKHFVNPREILGLHESLSPNLTLFLGVGDNFTCQEDFDLAPGERVIQVNVSETVTHLESVVTALGIRLSESMVVAEGLSLSM